MNDEYNDRIIEEKSYLKSEKLYWKKFTRWTDDPSWRNHEHCEFCWATFSEDIEGDLTKDIQQMTNTVGFVMAALKNIRTPLNGRQLRRTRENRVSDTANKSFKPTSDKRVWFSPVGSLAALIRRWF